MNPARTKRLLDFLRLVADGKAAPEPKNIWIASQHGALVQMLDKNGAVLTGELRFADVVGLQLTRRGQALLDGTKTSLPFNKADPPLNIRLWTSAFRRWTRNCPKGLYLAYSDEQLHVLAADSEGNVKNDDAHRLSSQKVPWVD